MYYRGCGVLYQRTAVRPGPMIGWMDGPANQISVGPPLPGTMLTPHHRTLLKEGSTNLDAPLLPIIPTHCLETCC
ncbi:hypothetical protein Y032_0003g1443 [Ancylostoma ceylanicum]|uniref:Uncharacterized protein n=1 Tax=Ancylostoma ceylanicum TaxID=53326 RepID=A0A016VXY2_9BILA|nr:hypothetical protein Y032_0003g1443 [Ancylostoma ceylanicum]